MNRCERCGKEFRDRCDLARHQARIRPCRSRNFKDRGQLRDPINLPKGPINLLEDPINLPKDPINLLEGPINPLVNENRCEFCFETKKKIKKHELVCKRRDDIVRVMELELDIKPDIPGCRTECRFCNKVLSRIDHLNKHLRICKEREEYHKQLIKQKEQQQVIQTQNNNIHNGNNNTIINNYFPENVIPFGQPRIVDDFTVQKAIDLLRIAVNKRLKDQGYEIAGDMIIELEKVLLERPENRNYILDNKSAICKVKTETGYGYTTKDDCIDRLTRENAGTLYSMKEPIYEANPKVSKSQTVTSALEHESGYSNKGSNYKPCGIRLFNELQNGLTALSMNINMNVVDFN